MTERSRRMIEGLEYSARGRFEDFLDRLDKALGDEKYVALEGRRAQVKQDAYYAQGRESLEAVNEKRAAAGLYLFKSEAENYKITNAKTSRHTLGLAMDVVPLDGEGNPTWDLGHYWKQFTTIRDCGRAAGLICGADWKDFTDWPHYEIKA